MIHYIPRRAMAAMNKTEDLAPQCQHTQPTLAGRSLLNPECRQGPPLAAVLLEAKQAGAPTVKAIGKHRNVNIHMSQSHENRPRSA